MDAEAWRVARIALGFFGCLLAALILVKMIVWTSYSYFEAQAYNRLTGSHVTTWDAMFVDLRVQAEPK